ncbi:hypothetical protein [Roseivirga sp. E12]|uniref:hypothetical protein n=1 Tax=Roseivirga sp. E12 TaxID=2819237 RepID=UPI001ABC8908|nr:hypothetical protein [Roseivirga sp. E12]MBO3697293.1 hypothetical protein [Roseivirga sp. E12]
MKKEIVSRLDKKQEILNYIEEITSGINVKTDIQQLINDDYPRLASFKIGLMNKGYNALYRLATQSNIQFEQMDSTDVTESIKRLRTDKDWVKNLDKLVLDVYKQFDKVAKSKEKRFATIRDSNAIVITQALNNLGFEKLRFCYLSTQRKSERLFNKSYVLSKSCNYRSANHLFALTLSIKQLGKKIAIDQTIDSLESLKRTLSENGYAYNDYFLPKDIRAIIDKYLVDYENWGVLAGDDLNEFQAAYNQMLGLRFFGNDTKALTSRLIEFFKGAKTKQIKKRAQHDQGEIMHFLSRYQEILEFFSKAEMYQEGGLDPVEGKNQILPICFPDDLSKQPFQDLLNAIVKVILDEGKNWKDIKDEVISYVKEARKTDSKGRTVYHEPLLIYSILALILEADPTESQALMDDTLRYVKQQKNILADLPREYMKRMDSYEIEIDYVACWAYRRFENYKQSIEIASKYMVNRPKDPRFYHGAFLSAYSVWYEYRKEKKRPKGYKGPIYEWEEVLALARNAYTKYKRLKGYTEIDHCIESLENSLAYLYAFKGKSQYDEEALELNEKGRKYLLDLKVKIPKTEWAKYPEYLHTESLLELSEARFYSRIGNTKQTELKARESHKTICRAISSCKQMRRLSLLRRCERLESRISEQFGHLLRT